MILDEFQRVPELYPRHWDSKAEPYRYYANYVQTYVERDVRLLKNSPDLTRFDSFLRLVAGRVGRIVHLSSLADDAGITHNTATSWLAALQTSYIVQPLQPYHRNFNKQIIKSPKLYFTDTGLLCYLLGIETDGMVCRPRAVWYSPQARISRLLTKVFVAGHFVRAR